MMLNRILLLARSTPDIEAGRRAAPTDCEVLLLAPDSPKVDATLPEIEYMIGYGKTSLASDFFERAGRLRLIQLLSAGYDVWDIDCAEAAGVPIATNGGANSTAVAEHTLMQMLALYKRLIRQHQNLVAGRWVGDLAALGVGELEGQTLGIVGLGAIGKKVARLARAFGMTVLYFDNYRLTEDAEDALGVRFRLLDEILRSSDVVSLHVPLTPATRGMIGAEQLSIMKPTAFLLNTCRGELIDEPALVSALNSSKIAGAALDVFANEPPNTDNPLLALDNVLLTPHLAGPSRESWPKRFRNAYDNIQRVSRGEAPLWVIPEHRR